MNRKLRNLVRIAILAAISAVLALIPGIPIIPPIYKLDFSLLPVLLAEGSRWGRSRARWWRSSRA